MNGLDRILSLLGIALLVNGASIAPVLAGERIPQLVEDGAAARWTHGELDLASAGRVCEPGARWIRLGFKELVLKSYDSLTIVGSSGKRYTFEGDHWSGRSFSTRAIEGDCVEIETAFADPQSRYSIDRYQYGTQPLADMPVVVAGAGDICDSGEACAGTADLIAAINPVAVFTAGDNAYDSGSLNEFNTRYDPYWGRFKELTNPTPGNHEYNTLFASGYFDYFNGAGAQTGPAGDRSKGYYSWDVGDWHFIALNSGWVGIVSLTELIWLENDLAANTKPCTAAYWHHPLISVGHYKPGVSFVKPIWDRLYDARVDLVLVGHDHNYQRYAPMTPDKVADPENGIRQVLVGTGGRSFYSLDGDEPLLEAGNADTHGVLKLTLTARGYTGEFVPSDGEFTDTFTGICHKAAPNQPPVAGFQAVVDGLTVHFLDASTDSDGTVASRAWDFGDGATSTEAQPTHVYAAAGSYEVTLTVTDDAGDSDAHALVVSIEEAQPDDVVFRDDFEAPGA